MSITVPQTTSMDMMQLIHGKKISVLLLVIKFGMRIMTVEGTQIITNEMAVLQSSNLNGGTYAINAIDDDTTTYSCTKKGPAQWWKVDFGRTVLLHTISVDPQAGSLCVVNTLTFLTSVSGSPGTPSAANRNWSVCASGITFVNNSDTKTISCSDSTYRVVRQLAILTNNTAKGLGLNEVQVNDLEPPVMANLTIRNLVQGNTFVNFQFSGWESSMPGEVNPEQYGVFLKDLTGSFQRILTILPNESASFLPVTITDLLPNTPYQIRVTAEIPGVLPAFVGNGSDIFDVTTSCDPPQKPESLDISQEKHERSSLISLNISWQMRNFNCDNVSYILVVNGSNVITTLKQTEPFAQIHNLQPNTNYCISLRVVHNTKLISGAATKCIFDESKASSVQPDNQITTNTADKSITIIPISVILPLSTFACGGALIWFLIKRKKICLSNRDEQIYENITSSAILSAQPRQHEETEFIPPQYENVNNGVGVPEKGGGVIVRCSASKQAIGQSSNVVRSSNNTIQHSETCCKDSSNSYEHLQNTGQNQQRTEYDELSRSS